MLKPKSGTHREQSKVTSAATPAKTKNEVYRAIGTDHPPPATLTLSEVKGCATFREVRRLFAAVTDDDDDILVSDLPMASQKMPYYMLFGACRKCA